MNFHKSRSRLLGSTVIGFGMAAIASSPAYASCAFGDAGDAICSTTVTLNTTVSMPLPAATSSRHIVINPTNDDPYRVVVEESAVISGYGLSISGAYDNELNFINNGGIQIDAGNTASEGGAAAVNISVSGAGDVNYSGAGSITNLGTSGAGLQIRSTGTGDLTANVGGDVTSASGSGIIVSHSGAAGSISVTTAAGTNIDASADGILVSISNADSASSVTVSNNAAILSGTNNSGIIAGTAGTGGVSLSNNGTIGTANDRTRIGINAGIGNNASNAAVDVSGTGAIFTSDRGIFASNVGAGTTTVNYTGAINTLGDTGIYASSTTGALTITSGAITATNGGGIDAHSTTGVQTINVGGAITASVTDGDGVYAMSTTGNQTINIGGNVSAYTGVLAISTSGNQTVNVTGGNVSGTGNGIVLSSAGTKFVTVAAGRSVTAGGDDHGAAINFNLGGAATINNAGTIGTAGHTAVHADLTTAAAINNQAGGTLNGRVDLSDGVDTIANNGTWNADGASDFGGGADSVTNANGGVTNTATGTTLAGLETLTNQAGATINTTGTLGFTGVATAFNNAGTWSLGNGAAVTGLGALTNSGIIRAEAGPASIATAGLANSGMIDLQDGGTDDVLTVTGNFVGSGDSTVALDVSSTGADRLVISGAASGVTHVDVNVVGELTLGSEGIRLVETGTSDAGAFVIGDVTGTELTDFVFQQHSDDQDFYLELVAVPSALAFDPLTLTNVGTDMWHQSSDVYLAYAAHKHSDLRNETRIGRIGSWGQLYWGKDSQGHRSTQNLFDNDVEVDQRMETERGGGQMGVDYNFGPAAVGLTAGYEHSNVDRKATNGSGIHASGYNIGAYGMVGGNIGFYGGLLFKYDRNKARLTDPAFDDVSKRTIKSTGIDVEAGYRMPWGHATVDFNGGLGWVKSSIKDFTNEGITYDFDKANSLRGRIGARIEGNANYGPWIEAKLLHEFNDDNKVTLISGDDSDQASAHGRGTWGRLEAGFGARGKPGPMASLWGELGDVQGVGLRAGWRF